MRRLLTALAFILATAAPAAAQVVAQGAPAPTSDARAWPFKIVFGGVQVDPRDTTDRAGRLLGQVTFGSPQAVTQSGSWAISFTAPQPVTGTFWQATQPVSLVSVPSHDVTNTGTFPVQVTSAPTTAVTGPLTDAQLRAAAVPVQAQANSGVDIGDVTVNNAAGASAVNVQDGGNSLTVDGPVTDVQLRATPVPVSGTVATGGLTDTELRAAPVTNTMTVSTMRTGTLQNAATTTGNGTPLDVTGMAMITLTHNYAVVGLTTLQWEASENGTDYESVFCVMTGQSAIAPAASTSVNSTNFDIFVCPVVGYVSFRARISAIGTGTVTVTAHASPIASWPQLHSVTGSVQISSITGTPSYNLASVNSGSVSTIANGTQAVGIRDAAGNVGIFTITGPGSSTPGLVVRDVALAQSGAGGYVRQDSTATIAKESGGNLATIAGAVSGGAVVVSSTNLDVRDLAQATDTVRVYGSDDGGTTGRLLKTDATGAAQVDVESLPSVTVGTFPDNEPINVAQMNGVAVSMNVGAAGTGTQRTAALIHDGTDTAQVTTTGGGSLQVECTAGCTDAGRNVVAIASSESVAAPTAAVWYLKRQWALPASAHAVPKRAWAAVTTAGSRTMVVIINNLGNLNLSTNTFTAANSVASPFFYGRLFGCVTTVMSATADTITPTYTDELGNSQAATGVAFAASSPVGNCYEFPLATASGPILDSGVRAVTAAADTAAPTGVVTFYGVTALLDTVGPANTLDSTVLNEGELNANEQIAILLMQAATTAQQRSAGLTMDVR